MFLALKRLGNFWNFLYIFDTLLNDFIMKYVLVTKKVQLLGWKFKNYNHTSLLICFSSVVEISKKISWIKEVEMALTSKKFRLRLFF